MGVDRDDSGAAEDAHVKTQASTRLSAQGTREALDGVMHFVSHPSRACLKGATRTHAARAAVLSVVSSKCTDIKGLAELLDVPYETRRMATMHWD
jgi:hypothetical protein